MTNQDKIAVGDRMRIISQEERFSKLADGTTRPLKNHNGQEGEVIEADPSRTQLYKRDKSDPGRTVQIITVRLDGETQLRAFPVDLLEKI